MEIDSNTPLTVTRADPKIKPEAKNPEEEKSSEEKLRGRRAGKQRRKRGGK